MKRIPLRTAVVAAFMLALLLLPAAVSAMDASIRTYLDGSLLETEHDPALFDEAPYVTSAFLQDELNVLAVWDNENRTLALERGEYKAQFVIHERHAVMNDNVVSLSAAPIVLYNEIYLPAREAGEALGFKVMWDVVNHGLQFYSPQDHMSHEDERRSEIEAASVEQADHVQAPVDRQDEQQRDEAQSDEANARPSDQLNVPDARADNDSGPIKIATIESVGEQLIIQGDGPLVSEVFMLSDPNRLVVDIANSRISTMLNGSPSALFGQVDSTHPYIENIRYSLFNTNPDITRIVVDLRQPVQYAVIEDSEAERLTINLQSREFQVVLDAGHGGKDPGAITYSDFYEKEFTLSLTLKIYELLLQEPYIEPVLTRSDDTFIELEERSAIANRIDADLFLSIHGNTYIPSVHGTETYYYDPISKAWAQTIHNHVVEATGFRDRNVRQQEYKVLRLAEVPAALIEIGYVSNKEQEALLYDDAFQDHIAQAVVDAIKQYLQLH